MSIIIPQMVQTLSRPEGADHLYALDLAGVVIMTRVNVIICCVV